MNQFDTENKKKLGKKWIAISVMVLLLAVLGLAVVWFSTINKNNLKYEGYQAVFLNNGQVYFGHVTSFGRDLVKLEDIYYLQVNQGLQSQREDSGLNQPDMSLVKLGNELHGPEDKMEIIRENILFIENLAEDSRVLKAIKDYTEN